MRALDRLSALKVQSLLKKPGRHHDGGGLYLNVVRAGDGFWQFRYRPAGHAVSDTGSRRTRYLGLGPVHSVSLAEARERAREARQLLLDRRDPISVRREAAAAALKVMTFRQVAEEFLQTDKIQRLKSDKHKAQWHSTLQVAFKAIGGLPIQSVDTKMILDFLLPIWKRTPETCTRLRGRIEQIFNYAISLNRFEGLNPARREVFNAHFTGRVRGHHKALSYEALPAFMGQLRQRDGVSAKALELLVLTASRTSEVIGCKWSEIDMAAATWSIPASRMKAGVEHVVPLSPRAVEILRAMREKVSVNGNIFTNGNNRPISNMAMLGLMKSMGVDATPHGMRAAFNTWAKNQTNFAPETRNAALAHTEEKLEQAYTRDKNRLMFDKRRRLMSEWASYLDAPAAVGETVVTLRA